MKFHHLNNDSKDPTLTGILGSHSDYKGIKASINSLEGNHGLPRPPFTNGNMHVTKQESLNGTANTRDGVELQQKKVIIHFQFNDIYSLYVNNITIL